MVGLLDVDGMAIWAYVLKGQIFVSEIGFAEVRCCAGVNNYRLGDRGWLGWYSVYATLIYFIEECGCMPFQSSALLACFVRSSFSIIQGCLFVVLFAGSGAG